MFVAIYHQIHDVELFKQKANAMAPPPEELRRHQFFPATDLSGASCLWEAPSAEALRDYIDPALEPASTQTYLTVNEDRAAGLPASEVV